MRLWIWSYLLKYTLMENFTFGAVGLSTVLQSFLKSCSTEARYQGNLRTEFFETLPSDHVSLDLVPVKL